MIDPVFLPVRLTVGTDGTVNNFASASLNLSMLECSSSFDIQYVAARRLVAEQSPVSIYIGDTEVISGYVDTAEDEHTADGLFLRISGRSATADLEDCSLRKIVIHGQDINGIVDQLVNKPRLLGEAPDVQCVVESAAGAAIEPFRTTRGESYYEAIMRACNQRALFAYANADKLVIRGVADSADSLVNTQLRVGENVVSTRRTTSSANRFSNYILNTQGKSTDTDNRRSVAEIKTDVRDDFVTRFRPMVVSVNSKKQSDLQAKAEWERNRRIALGDVLVVQVMGFGTGDRRHPVWVPNRLVTYAANPMLGVDRDTTYLITDVRFAYGSGDAQIAELTLVVPSSLTPLLTDVTSTITLLS